MKIIILSLIVFWFAFVGMNFLKFNLFLVIFILFVAVERFWETFFAAKHNILDKKSQFDWLFRLILFCYVLLMYGNIYEYLYIPKQINYALTASGIVCFFLALVIKLSAIRSLGGKWESHVLGENKQGIARDKLIQNGPYRYIRHPIYLGAIIEAISIPLVFNSFFTLIFSVLIYGPLFVYRALLEEKESVKKFGEDYAKYISAVPAFFPYKKDRH
jgi:protein-S-isoprenylcysteine O-methyltransferase Ste14